MSELFRSVTQLWHNFRAGHLPLPEATRIPVARCEPAADVGYTIRRDEMYFSVYVNEMYLADNRQAWASFDPLVVVVTEFNYDKERVTIPTIVGPNLIRKHAASDQPRY